MGNFQVIEYMGKATLELILWSGFFVVNVYTIVYTYKYREDIVFKRSMPHGNRITEMG